MAIAFGIWYSFSVFFVAILEEFDWSRGKTASLFSVFVFIVGISGPFVGTLSDRFGPRKLICMGAVLVTFGLAVCSQVNTLWQLYLFYSIITAFGIGCTGFLPNVAMITNWFHRKRGMAIGIGSAGIGVGTLVLIPLVQHFILIASWRKAYLLLACCSLFVIIPLNIFFQRHKPEELGLLPDGESSVHGKDSFSKNFSNKVELSPGKEWTVLGAMKDYHFWMILAGIFLVVFTTQGILIHSVARIIDGGYPKMHAAFALSIVGVMGSVGKIVWGGISDSIGRIIAYAFAGVFIIGGIVLLIILSVTHGAFLLYVFAILFGFGYGGAAPLNAAISADIFEGENFGAIFGWIMTGVGIGGAMGPWVVGYTFDLLGSYTLAFTLDIIFVCIAITCFWIARPRHTYK
ncbi:MAG: MFS transporter [Thermodesulfobacteriota bacterium]|nr:MFS transporter [Thermodesulfobacteriota bacterium]